MLAKRVCNKRKINKKNIKEDFDGDVLDVDEVDVRRVLENFDKVKVDANIVGLYVEEVKLRLMFLRCL